MEIVAFPTPLPAWRASRGPRLDCALFFSRLPWSPPPSPSLMVCTKEMIWRGWDAWGNRKEDASLSKWVGSNWGKSAGSTWFASWAAGRHHLRHPWDVMYVGVGEGWSGGGRGMGWSPHKHSLWLCFSIWKMRVRGLNSQSYTFLDSYGLLGKGNKHVFQFIWDYLGDWSSGFHTSQ